MAVKKCTIITDRYKINIISYRSKNQTVDVELIDGTMIVYDLIFADDKTFCFKPKETEYYCKEFYCYIKSLIEDALKWIEYWQDLTNREVWALAETRPNFF